MSGLSFEKLLSSAEMTAGVSSASWDGIHAAFPAAMFDQWLDGLRQFEAMSNAPVIINRYVAASIALGTRIGADAFLGALPTALTIGRYGGSRGVEEFLGMLPLIAPEAKDAAAFVMWLRTIEELSTQAPESVAAVVRQSSLILSRLSVRGFRSWVFNGIHAAKGDATSRLAYFSDVDTQSLSSFERSADDVVLADVERPLRAFCRALWVVQPALRSAAIRPGGKAVRRSSFDGLFVQLPEVYSGYRGSRASAHFFAAVAHVAAHIVHTRARFERGTLKPLQIALVGLIEDARVEALAAEEYPGLRRLWLQFHNARPGTAVSAELLMMRLARALIDPLYSDDDPWVRKGKAMFFERRDRWADPRISREIGNLLGNDLGQMRIQFNGKSYIVEPSYRDDGNGIWQFDEPPPEQSSEADAVLESVRLDRQENDAEPDKHTRSEEAPQNAGRAAPAKGSEDDSGVPISRQPEWDHVSGTLRHDWTTLVEIKPRQSAAGQIDAILAEHEAVEQRIARLVRATKLSRPRRLRAQLQGDRLDLEACIGAAIDRRAGLLPESRIFESREMLSRDLSVLLLLDVSESTRDRVRDTNTTVLAMERAAAALMAKAMDDLGDPFAIHAFCSNGRSEVRYYRVKDFHEPYTALTRGALAGLRGMMSTRLGAALRQSGDEIASQATHRKLVMVITDGEPSDIDVPDRNYLVEDARIAVQSLAHRGIDVFCVGLESDAESALPRIFGRRNFLKLARVDALPERLPALYLRLTV